MAICKTCAASFEITDRDRGFYEKISPVIQSKKYLVPVPQLCPDCRQQRRLAFYNRRTLYRRGSDATGKPIISIYSPDKPFKVYEKSAWFSDSWFLKDCIGCKNCFGCTNLERKEFYIFNKSYTKEEYQKILNAFHSGSFRMTQDTIQKVEDFYLTQPVRPHYCKNAFYCFDSNYLQDCEYVSDDQVGCRDCMDIDIWGEAMELCYNSCAIGLNLRNIIAGYYVSEGAHDIYYSIFCSRNSDHLFGCSGLRHRRFCILNKQYTPQEYEKTVAQIIEDMQRRGAWGEFFPPEMSAFAYNETIAADHFPLSKEEVVSHDWQWKDPDDKSPEVTKTIKATGLLDTITEITDEILDWAILCEETGRPFRITGPELAFYKRHNLPIPHVHPDIRFQKRIALRNPHHLWKRSCAKCNAEIETSYSPERPEIVYCEQCYRAIVN